MRERAEWCREKKKSYLEREGRVELCREKRESHLRREEREGYLRGERGESEINGWRNWRARTQ